MVIKLFRHTSSQPSPFDLRFQYLIFSSTYVSRLPPPKGPEVDTIGLPLWCGKTLGIRRQSSKYVLNEDGCRGDRLGPFKGTVVGVSRPLPFNKNTQKSTTHPSVHYGRDRGRLHPRPDRFPLFFPSLEESKVSHTSDRNKVPTLVIYETKK